MDVDASASPAARARALRPAILAARESIEAERRLVDAVVKPIVDTGLARLFVPADAGGPQVEPLAAYAAYEELAAADASVAWVAWNNGLPAILSRGLDAETRCEIFGDPRALYANSTRPSGRAVATSGGVRLTGRWSLVSGCELASWIPLFAPVFEDDTPRRVDGRPDLQMFFVPKSDYEILDTWYTGGLRGSGSHDVVVEDVFVPAARGVSPFAPATLEGPLFAFPFVLLLAGGCASLCLGIARSAFETLLELSVDRPQFDPVDPLRERPAVHVAVADAETRLDAARLLLRDAFERMWDACASGVPGDALRASAWRAVSHAAAASKAVVTAMFESGGTTALYTDSLLERCNRDIWAVTQHIVLNPMWREQAGRVRLGLSPTQPLF